MDGQEAGGTPMSTPLDRIKAGQERARVAWLASRPGAGPKPRKPRTAGAGGGPSRRELSLRSGTALEERAEATAATLAPSDPALRRAIRQGREAFGARSFFIVRHRASGTLRAVDSLECAPGVAYEIVREVRL